MPRSLDRGIRHQGGTETGAGMSSYADGDVMHKVSSRRRPRVRARFSRDGLGTVAFLLPLLVIFGVFSWFPIVRALVMSLQETNLVSEPTFVGVENFARVLADPLFATAVRNTAYFSFLALIIGFPIPIVLAVIMSEARRGKAVMSALAYLPVVVPPVVSVLLWRCFFSPPPPGGLPTLP